MNKFVSFRAVAYFLSALLIAIIILAVRYAFAADYPPVRYLQDKLPAHPGDQIPKYIEWPPRSGHMMQPRYLSGHYDGNGVYSVKLKLDSR